MRKVLLLLTVLFMTAPALAVSNVNITCVDDDVNTAIISYDITGVDPNLVRAFALDITTDGNIMSVTALEANYRIFPGQIVIDGGQVTDYNTPYAPGDLNDTQVTVEMGSLYTLDSNYSSDPNAGYNMVPGTDGNLLEVVIENATWYCVDQNALRGGVVMEDPDEEPNVTVCCGSFIPICTVPDIVYLLKADADANIVAAGLNIGNVTFVFSDTNIGEVTNQNPAPGSSVPCDSNVDYEWICRAATCLTCLGDWNGDNWVRIPDLTAMSAALSGAPAYRIRNTTCEYNPCCDINGDGWLRIPDYTAMSNYINTLGAYRCRCDLCGPW